MSRVFNPAYIDNPIAWLSTSGIRIIVVNIGVYSLLKLLSILIGRVKKSF